ncbi:MAG: TrbI/VirB10 family protein [Methylophilaceae bacterium]
MATIKPVTMTPQRKKQLLMLVGVGAVLLALVLLAGYFAQQKTERSASTSTAIKDPNQVSLTVPGQQLNDKDVWRANEGSKIVELHKQIEDLKENIQKGDFDKAKTAALPPNLYPNAASANANAAFDPRSKMTEVPLPPPPIGSFPQNGKPLQPFSGGTLQPPNRNGQSNPTVGTEQDQAVVLKKPFSLEVTTDSAAKTDASSVKTDGTLPVKAGNYQASGDADKTAENYLPAGTFMRVAMLSGLDAPTGGQAQTNPHPVLFRVLDPAQLPNLFQANMKDCVVTGNAYGDISSERAYVRLDRLSCIDDTGGAIDVAVKGYAAGEDGKAGLRGRLVSKQGRALANAFLAGIGSGMGQAFKDSATTISQSALGATQTVNQGQELQAGLATGVGSAMNMLAKYYIKLAEQIFPVIEVDGGRVVDLILTKGISIERH